MTNLGQTLLIPVRGAATSTAAFAPSDITGLRVWLRGDDLTGSDAAAVSAWTDASGNGYNGAQATGAKQPTKRTNVLNTHTVARFDGGDCIQTSTVAYASAQALSVYCVGSCVSGSDRAFLESGASTSATNGTYILYRASTNVVSFYGHHTADSERQSVATVTGTSDFTLMTGIWNRAMLNHHLTYTYVDGDASGTINPAGSTPLVLADAVLNVGSRNNAASLPLNGDIAEVIVYTGAHTASQRKQVEDYLATKYALTPRSITANIVFEGDSLTEADRGTGPYLSSYPQQLLPLFPATGIHFWNTGVSGQTLAQMDTDKATQITPLYSSTIAKNALVLWGGTNDMAGGVGNQTAAVALSRLYALADYHRTQGWYVVLLSCIDRTDASAGVNFNSRRATFNTDFDTNAISHADAIVALHNDARLMDSTNSTYFDADLVHLNAAGHAIVATAVRDALGTLIVDTTNYLVDDTAALLVDDVGAQLVAA